MRQSPSGAIAGSIKYKLPSGTLIGASGGSWSSVTNLYGKPGDNVVANWDENSFGPRGPLQVEATIENTGQVLVYAWNWTGNPVTTGTDLFINLQLIPRA